MADSVAELADVVCELLTAVNASPMHKTLQAEARKRGITLEQLVAAALAESVNERFLVTAGEGLN